MPINSPCRRTSGLKISVRRDVTHHLYADPKKIVG